MAAEREYQIEFARDAIKALEDLDKKIQRRVWEAIGELKLEPRPQGCEKLAGKEDRYRIRVGHYRVIYTIQDKQLIILVVKIGHRRDVYRQL